MLPLLLLIGLAAAHEDEPPPAQLDVPPARRQIGDLAIEGTLARLGLAATQATQVQADWMPAMEAPRRSRDEGRGDGWAFDVAHVWVTERRLADGVVVHKTEAAGTWLSPDPCAHLATSEGPPMALTPLARPIRRVNDELFDDQAYQRTITVADNGHERLMIISLLPGESATLVEVVGKEGAKTRRRARKRRKLSVMGTGADLSMHEAVDGADMCVTVHPPPEVVQVSFEDVSLAEQVKVITDRLETEAKPQDDPPDPPRDDAS